VVEDPEDDERDRCAEGGLDRDSGVVEDEGGSAHPRADNGGMDGKQPVWESADVEVDRGQPRPEPGDGQGGQQQRPAGAAETPGEESAGGRDRQGDPPAKPGRGLAGFVVMAVGKSGDPPPDEKADERSEKGKGCSEDQVVTGHRWDPSWIVINPPRRIVAS